MRTCGESCKKAAITREEIHDKSKANIFVKALSALQIFGYVLKILYGLGA